MKITKNFTYGSEVSSISPSDIENVFNNLYKNSPSFATKVAEIQQAGGNVLIIVTSSGGLAGANAENKEGLYSPEIDTVIRIPADAFNGDYYVPQTGTFSLERLLAHETYHAWWDVTDGVEGENKYPTEEQDAVDFANTVRDEQLTSLGLPLEPHRLNQAQGTEDNSLGNNNNITDSSGPNPSDSNSDGQSDAPNSWWDNLLDQLNDLLPDFLKSPLVVDLDGDGVELYALGDYGSFFDLDGDGQAQLTGWVSPDDGLLALDVNGNGRIDDITELFGSADTDGFKVLAQYDGNSDGVIDANDAVFENLLIWTDVNSDGVSQASELHSLSDYDIASISLDTQLLDEEYIAGNQITHEATYTMTDGTERQIVDAWFAYDPLHTVNVEDYTFDIRTAFMPTIKGYGGLKDLHIAASADNDETDPDSLMAKLIDLSDGLTFEDALSNWDGVKAHVEQILFRWAGIEDIDPASRGEFVDAQHMAFYEAFRGFDFSQYGQENPLIEAGQYTEAVYDFLLEYHTIVLVAQITGEDIFADSRYDLYTGTVTGDLTLTQSGIDAIEAEAVSSGDSVSVWTHFAQFLGYTKGLDNISTDELLMLDTAVTDTGEASLDDWSDVITRMNATLGTIIESGDDFGSFEVYYDTDITDPNGNGSGTVYGSDTENDYIEGLGGRDFLYGLGGHDKIDGGSGDDDIYGGAGDDFLIGGYGDDWFFYESGNDTIYDTYGADDQIRVLASTGLTSENIADLYRSGDDMVIQFDNGEFITIDNHFYSNDCIETLTFLADGSSIDLLSPPYLNYYGTAASDTMTGKDYGETFYGYGGNDKIKGADGDDIIYGGAGVDRLEGEEGNDSLYGGVGDDKLFGSWGDDFLDGGEGNDWLIDGAGNNTYQFSAGNDIIFNAEGEGTILFSPGIELSDLTFSRPVGYQYSLEYLNESWLSSDLLIECQGNSALLDGQYKNSYYSNSGLVRYLEFADGTIVDLTEYAIDVVGTENSDVLSLSVAQSYEGGSEIPVPELASLDYTVTAGDGDDLITGGWGNDTLLGGAGDDFYTISFGQDIITDESGYDMLILETDLSWYDGLTPFETLDYYYDGPFADLYEFYASFEANGDAVISFGDPDASIVLTGQVLEGNTSIVEEILWYGLSLDITNLGSWIFGTYDADVLTGDILIVNNDVIFGYSGDDTIYGGAGDDIIFDNFGNNFIEGGAGNDLLNGGYDSEVYSYNSGDGDDLIRDMGGDNDALSFGSGITLEDLSFTLDPSPDFADLEINFTGSSSDRITINGQAGAYSNGQIETLLFADGFSLSLDRYRDWIEAADGTADEDTILGSSGDDVLYAGDGNDELHGMSGNDTLLGEGGDDLIHGGEGNDTITGGTGDDMLWGGEGDDTFIFASGYGTDVINETGVTGVSSDTVIMQGLVAGEVTFAQNGDDLEVLIDSTTDKLVVTDFFINPNAVIETFLFADGTEILEADIPDIIANGGKLPDGETIIGTEGNDVLNGTELADTLEGLDGNDRLYGRGGNDTLNGGAGSDQLYGHEGDDILDGGDGNDYTLVGGEGSDTIYGGAGNDVIYDTASTHIDGGEGTDEADFRAETSGVTANVTTGELYNEAGEVGSITGIEIIDGSDFNDNFTGSEVNDRLYGRAGNDVLIGGAGSDQLYGHEGDDILDGGDGNDYTLVGGEGSDTIYGGAGNDVIYDTASTHIDGGEGTDEADFRAETSGVTANVTTGELYNEAGEVGSITGIEIIDGSDFNDNFTGSDAVNDRLYGRAGNDVLMGMDGSDQLYGHEGDDILDGGDGNDYTLVGGEGSDTIYGGAGNDVIYDTASTHIDGGEGTDEADFRAETSGVTANVTTGELYNEAGEVGSITGIEILDGSDFDDHFTGSEVNDRLYGRAGNDVLMGMDGSDQLYGHEGDDILDGGDGNDYTLVGGEGSDTIYGGAGNDVIYDTASTHIDGGEGTDEADFRAETSGVTANVTTGELYNEAGEAGSITGIEIIDGSDFNDNFTGSEVNDRLYGRAGNDVLMGMAGSDQLYGHEGDDILDGGDGNDYTLVGGEGNDTIYGGAGNDVIYDTASTHIDGGEGIDEADFRAETSGVTANATTGELYNEAGEIGSITGIEIIDGSDFNDVFTGSEVNDRLYGRAGNDVLMGMDGSDQIYGHEGDDILYGGDGNDYTLVGGEGNDTIYGGAGNDVIYDTASTHIDGGEGTDEADFRNETSGVTANVTTGELYNEAGEVGSITGIEIIDGSDFNDNFAGSEVNDRLYGRLGDDHLYGGDGSDQLYGHEGNDVLDGGDGNDYTLVGGDGNDTIYGGAGNDVLYGDEGNDVLYGQAGTDTLWGGGGSDTFVFEADSAFDGQDTIRDFDAANDSIDLSNVLYMYDPLTDDINDFLSATEDASGTHLQVDLDGAGTAETFARIVNLQNTYDLGTVEDMINNGQLVIAA